MLISRRKRKFSKRSRRHTQKCAARRELTSWFTCVTLSVLYCLFVVLLTKCMDVEKNPGPDENFVTLMQNVDWTVLTDYAGHTDAHCTHQLQDG